jgi:hypothetical protein
VLGDGLRGRLSRDGLLWSDLSRDGLLRGSLLSGVLLNNVLLDCGKGRFASLGSSHIGRIIVPGSGFLLGVADGSLTKILYRTPVIKAILLPRVDRVIRHLDETVIETRKLIIRED